MTVLDCDFQLTFPVYFLYPETRGVPLEEMDKYVGRFSLGRELTRSRLFGDEADVGDDEDEEEGEDDGDDAGSDASSINQHLMPNGRKGRSTSRGSRSINSARKPSPLPSRRDQHSGPSGLLGGLGDAISSVFGQKRNRGTVRGDYDAVGGEQ